MSNNIKFSQDFIQSYSGSKDDLIKLVKSIEFLVESRSLDNASTSVTFGGEYDKILEITIP